MKAHSLQLRSVGGVEVQLHTFFTLALDGGEQSASCLDHFIPGKKRPWYTPDRKLGPRGGLDTVTKRENPFPCQKLKPSLPALSLDAILTELSKLYSGELNCY